MIKKNAILGNYYNDLCLFAAGGQALGKLDFYQVHTYAPYGSYAPFRVFVYLLSVFMCVCIQSNMLHFNSRSLRLVTT